MDEKSSASALKEIAARFVDDAIGKMLSKATMRLLVAKRF